MIVVFNEVSITGVRYIVENGKRKRQQKKFYQTINPFNKAADGSPKSRSQIIDELQAEIARWEQS